MPRKIDTLIIHCADTPATMDIGADTIRQWHTKDRGWKDIGYHFVIRRDGAIESGRDLDGDGDVLDEIGAHAMGFNQASLGICLVGGKPDFNFTAAQMKSLESLVHVLTQAIPGVKVIGHRDVSNKACPGFDVGAYFSHLTKAVV